MKELSKIKLVDVYNDIPKDRVFEHNKKYYKILGFDIEAEPVCVYAVRILKKTWKPSPKQPIFEVFTFDQIENQNIRNFLKKDYKKR